MIRQAEGEAARIDVEIARRPHDQLVSLVEATSFGSEGLRYRRLNVQSQIDRFREPTFFHATVDGELAGVYLLDKRDLLINHLPVTGYYRGVLAVDKRYQGMGIGKCLARRAIAWLNNEAKVKPVVSYGCIDQSNQRSLNLLQSVGAQIGPSLSMYMMYRQWPSVCCQLEPLSDELVHGASSLATELYAECAARDVSESTLPGWVLRDSGTIAISARVSTTAFQITDMGNMAAWTTRYLVRPFAPARRRFDPDCFRYVSFSHVLIRPGCEKLWPRFVSTVMAQQECHFGAVFVDPRSQLFLLLQQAQGLMRFLHSSQGSIRVVWQTFADADGRYTVLPDNPAGISLWPVDA